MDRRLITLWLLALSYNESNAVPSRPPILFIDVNLPPTVTPSIIPSQKPTINPSQLPTIIPSLSPSIIPSTIPTLLPTTTPTLSQIPSIYPKTNVPSATPSYGPTYAPTSILSYFPTSLPTTRTPTNVPSLSPSSIPTIIPTITPTSDPSIQPSNLPSVYPTNSPTFIPTEIPSFLPSTNSSITPSHQPTITPTKRQFLPPLPSPTNTTLTNLLLGRNNESSDIFGSLYVILALATGGVCCCAFIFCFCIYRFYSKPYKYLFTKIGILSKDDTHINSIASSIERDKVRRKLASSSISSHTQSDDMNIVSTPLSADLNHSSHHGDDDHVKPYIPFPPNIPNVPVGYFNRNAPHDGYASDYHFSTSTSLIHPLPSKNQRDCIHTRNNNEDDDDDDDMYYPSIDKGIGVNTTSVLQEIDTYNWDSIFMSPQRTVNDLILGTGAYGTVIHGIWKCPNNSNTSQVNVQALRTNSINGASSMKEIEVAIKIISKSSLSTTLKLQHLRGDNIFHKLCERAYKEIHVLNEIQKKITDEYCIIRTYGIVLGVLPPYLCHLLKVPLEDQGIGILMRYEGGGSLATLIHYKGKKLKNVQSSIHTHTQLSSIPNSPIRSNNTAMDIQAAHTYPYSIPMIEKIRLLKEIAYGLSQLHIHGIIHGDMKPENILLNKDIPPRVSLADFGMSSLIPDYDSAVVGEGGGEINDELEGNRPLPQTTMQITTHTRGTPVYCAPEMLVNPFQPVVNNHVSKSSRKADMYAFGILAWEVLSQKRPYEHVKNEGVLCVTVHLNQRPPVEDLPSDTPAVIIEMITKCWDTERSKRISAIECYKLLFRIYHEINA